MSTCRFHYQLQSVYCRFKGKIGGDGGGREGG